MVLFDGNPMEGNGGAKLRQDILAAQQMPHALLGKVALVGFSLGGGMALYYGGQMPDLVAGAVAWFPATVFIKGLARLCQQAEHSGADLRRGKRYLSGQCLIGHARALAAAISVVGKPLDLVTYTGANHDFIPEGDHYNPAAYADAWQKTLNRLKQYLGGQAPPRPSERCTRR